MSTTIGNRFKRLNEIVVPSSNCTRRKRILELVAIYFVAIYTFITLMSQMPFLTKYGASQLLQFGWIFAIIPLLMADYKKVLNIFFKLLILLIPFLLYCVVAICFKVNSFSYNGTRYLFISSYLFILGFCVLDNNTHRFKLFASAFIVGALLLGIVIFFTQILHSDSSTPIYAVDDKNSVAPILMIAGLLSFYIFNKRKPFDICAKWILFVFFSVIVYLTKCRAVMVFIPAALLTFLIFDLKKHKVALITVLSIIFFCVILIVSIPFLRQKIIVEYLLNNRTTWDEIFSGRLTIIANKMKAFKPLLGSGGTYFDCMPLSLLCSYGVFGFILILPILILPFYSIFKSHRMIKENSFFVTCVLVGSLLLLNSLLEGYGFIGPGAKVFIFWILAGGCYSLISKAVYTNKCEVLLNRTSSITNKIKSSHLLLALEGILVVVSIITLSVVSIPNGIGDTIMSKLPSNRSTAEYKVVTSKQITIFKPVETMCVGQTITYSPNYEPKDAYDAVVRWHPCEWITYQPFTINEVTGEVTANELGPKSIGYLAMTSLYTEGQYIGIPIRKIEEYVFDKIVLSSEPITKTLETSKNNEITLKQNYSSIVYYDQKYIPDPSYFSFYSTDSSIATVDEKTGVVKAISPGECEIKGKSLGENSRESLNSIKIVVEKNDDAFIPVSSISVKKETSYCQHINYEIVPSFNGDASDKSYDVYVDGLEHTLKDNVVTFHSFGNAHIKVVSRSNNSVFEEFDVEVLENKPVGFSCQTDWIVVGETKNAEELGLYIEFENGQKRIVAEDDLIGECYKARAYKNKNGYLGGRTKVMAVTSGSIIINCQSKYNQELVKSFKLTVNSISKTQYNYLCNGIGLVIISFITLISFVVGLFIKFKRKWVYVLINLFFLSLYVLICVLIYKFSPFSISMMCIISAICLAELLYRLIIRKNKELMFFEEAQNRVNFIEGFSSKKILKQ